MFDKTANYTITAKDIEPLNVPEFSSHLVRDEYLNLNKDLVKLTINKIAESQKESSEKSGDAAEAPIFDLESEIEQHPDSLFIKCFAIKANETNDNGDYFGEDELRKATSSFVGVPLFTNHANSDINEARGKVVHSWWDEDKNGIMIVGRVDAAAYPQLARGIKEEYVVGTSMGCQVQHSLCSVCHNYAETPDQYCGCVRERKTRQVSAKNQECNYHEQGPDDNCPMCGCKKGETKKFSVNTKVFEYNYGIKFIENSFVVNPACADCGITEVIDPTRFIAKVAEITKRIIPMMKWASETDMMCTDQKCIKFAGQQELDSLNQALDLVSSVSKTMLEQKEQIDLEFLSDLVKVLADLQTVSDELTEQGYGRLQSPGQPPQQGQPGEQGQMGGGPPGEVTRSVAPPNAAPGGGKIQNGPAGVAGTATSPMANRKILNLEKLSSTLLNNQNKKIKVKLEIPQTPKSTLKFASKVNNRKLKLPFIIPPKQ